MKGLFPHLQAIYLSRTLRLRRIFFSSLGVINIATRWNAGKFCFLRLLVCRLYHVCTIMEDGTSTCTSADGTEDFGDNPTRDSLTEGILNLLKPTVDSLENSIKSTRY